MASRERVVRALRHDAGGVPMDFGSSGTTGMHCSCVEALRQHYGLEPRPVKVHEPYQMLGLIEDDLKQAIGIDVVGVGGRNTLFGFPNENWKPWRTPWGQDVLVSEHFNTTSNDAGDVFIHPGGDLSVPASGHMPASGFFFDTIIRQPEIDEGELDPADNLEEFGPISDEELEHLRNGVDEAASSGRSILLTLPGTALGDIALVPAPFLKHPRGIRDIAEWYMSLAARREYIHAIFEKQVEIALGNLPKIHAAVGDRVDAVFLCGTDFGTQNSTFCSSGTFRELYLPYYRQLTDWIHQNTNWLVFKHSCGAVETLISDFIDAGFDILNPVQVSATGMDPDHLKATYGEKLVFWGGGVDTQHTLPFDTPEAVREQVLRRCEAFAADGGFVFNAIHNVQAQTPVQNIVAMIDAVHEFNGAR